MRFKFAANDFPAHRILICLIFVAVGSVLALPAAAQDIWVDFTSDFHDGADGDANGVADWIDELNQATSRAGADQFSAAERATIEGNILNSLNNIYACYNLNFVTNEPNGTCLLYTSPSPRDRTRSRMPSSA